MDYIDRSGAPQTRIDSRILRHLLQEASDLLEEAQTHALVEKQSETTASVLAQTNWRMTATCLWAIGELMPGSGDAEQAARLHVPFPVFGRNGEALSAQLDGFVQRVDRLHDRARRLDDLSRGPTVSTETADASASRAVSRPTGESAAIIPLFGAAPGGGRCANPIERAQSQVRRAMHGGE